MNIFFWVAVAVAVAMMITPRRESVGDSAQRARNGKPKVAAHCNAAAHDGEGALGLVSPV
jgi:hypothetical protein